MRASQLVLLVGVVLPAGMLLAYFNFVVAGKVRRVQLPKDHTRPRYLWLLALLHIFWIGMLVSVWRDA